MHAVITSWNCGMISHWCSGIILTAPLNNYHISCFFDGKTPRLQFKDRDPPSLPLRSVFGAPAAPATFRVVHGRSWLRRSVAPHTLTQEQWRQEEYSTIAVALQFGFGFTTLSWNLLYWEKYKKNSFAGLTVYILEFWWRQMKTKNWEGELFISPLFFSHSVFNSLGWISS